MDEIKSHAGISISASKFQILEVARESETYEIININESYFNQPINFETEKDTIIEAQLQSAFDEIQLKQSLKSSQVSFTLPQEIFLTVQLPYDNTLLHRNLINDFRWELSLLYPFIPSEELVIQIIEMERNSVNTKNKALVIAIEKKHLKLISNFCLKNNLSLRYIDSAMLAANRLINSMNYSSNNGLVLNILSSKNSFSIVLNVNGKLAYTSVFTDLRNEKVVDILTKELASSSLINVKKELFNEAYISGEDISAEFVYLRLATGLNFKQLNPFTNLKVKSGIENQHFIKEKYSSFTSTAGIAFRLA